MRAFALYALQRLGQFVLVVFIGINIAYLISHATPIDPVEQSVSAATSFGQTSPDAINMLRESLRDLYQSHSRQLAGLRGRAGRRYPEP